MNWQEVKKMIDDLNIPDDVEVEEVTLIEPSDKDKIVVFYSSDGKRCVIET